MSLFNSLSESNANRFFQSTPWQHWGVVGIFFLFMGLFCEHVATAQGREKTSNWTVVREGAISVYTDAGAQAATRTLERVRTMAELFREFGRPAIQRPVRIVVFRSTTEFENYRPSAISAGFFQSGAECDWIVFPADSQDRVLLHEFTHLLLHRATSPIPQWLEEGLAEYFSTTRVRGTYAEFGHAIPEHQRNLTLQEPMTAKDLTSARKTGIHYADPYEAARFYATSWMLVHMLYSEPRFTANMPAFVIALDKDGSSAIPGAELFRESFGVSLDNALLQARQLALASTFRGTPARRIETGQLELTPAKPAEAVPTVETAQLQAELLLDCGKPERAASKFQWIARQVADASPAERESALGYLALAKGTTAEAMSRFASAIAAGTKDARTVFEYAMLLREQQKGIDPQGRDAVTRWIEKAVELDPNYAEALFLLGVRASDRKEYTKAIVYLTKATTILPRQSPFWHALGFAQVKSGDMGAARLSAHRALRAAETPENEEMAQALLQMHDLAPMSASKERQAPATHVGDGWQNPQGDATTSGTLNALRCAAADGPQLEIRTSAGIETFSMKNPRQIQIDGGEASSIEWKCGKIDPRRVSIEYRRSSRELVALHFLP